MRSSGLSRLAVMIGLLAILAGCALNVPAPTQLPNTAAASAPAVDIEANGTRHAVWQDCGNGCSILYNRTTSAGATATFTISPLGGESYSAPDIAIADDGRAFIVWRSLIAATNQYVSYFVIVPTGATVIPVKQILAGASAAGAGIDPPSVVARGDTVYAVYLMTTSAGVHLHKRRLNPLDPAGTQMTANPSTRISNVSLAIDSAGALHTAYEYSGIGSEYQAVFYHGPSSGQRLLANNAIHYDYYSKPDLELDASDTAYVLYATNSRSLDVFQRQTSGAEKTFALLPGGANGWSISWWPDMAVVGSALEIAFTGSGATTPMKRVQVWKASLNPGSGAVTPPAVISPDTVYMAQAPRIVNVQGYPVIVWTQVDPGSWHCTYESYWWEKSSGAKKVFTSTGCYADEFDLAARGEWLAGVAISGAQNNANLPSPWIAFNTK
ncbi:MAG TPA: hypothetical protein VD886_00300 [Herpetosiphonaceae bacterium]|nr:hypothetical protein [Herpetosiphonaceae bacterium]